MEALLGGLVIPGEAVPPPCGVAKRAKVEIPEMKDHPVTAQDHYDNAVALLARIGRDKGGPASFYASSQEKVFSDGRITQAVDAPCHYNLTLRVGVDHNKWKGITLGSNFNFPLENEEPSLMYWRWLTSKKRSPWRKLLERGLPRLVTASDGKISGFYFVQEQLELAHFKFLKNFCIAARLVHEYPGQIAAWREFVQLGLPEAEAFILCTFYTKSLKTGLYYAQDSASSGAHWPLTFDGQNDGGWFDYYKFTKGEPLAQSTAINGFWGDAKESGRITEIKGFNTQAAEVLRGFFTVSRAYRPSILVNGYRQWKSHHKYGE